MSFDTSGRTMMGIGASDLVDLYYGLQPAAYACGTNCGVGAAEVVTAVMNIKALANDSNAVIVAKANGYAIEKAD